MTSTETGVGTRGVAFMARRKLAGTDSAGEGMPVRPGSRDGAGLLPADQLIDYVQATGCQATLLKVRRAFLAGRAG